jgi:hypothetical protein
MGTIGLVLFGVFILMVVIRMIGSIFELIWKVAGAVSQMLLFVVLVCIIVPLIAS